MDQVEDNVIPDFEQSVFKGSLHGAHVLHV